MEQTIPKVIYNSFSEYVIPELI